jgi:UDP-N-acetyl-D-glucosamine dehydrogenase
MSTTPKTTPPPALQRTAHREVAIVGAGYVGIPLAHVFAQASMGTVLLDIDAGRVAAVNRGESYIEDVPSDLLAPLVERELVAATTDYDALRQTDAVIVALPTPLTANREPDLSIVLSAVRKIAERLRPGHLVVLESTTYPGTTREEALPILERSGLKVGEDFFLAFSPERVDPGRSDWTTKTTPKIVGGVTPACTERARALYERALDTVIPVSSPEAAELTKLLENIFRSVNIALVNELAQLCDRMRVDVWEVIDAAATKPFGFMSFQPGPGLGGHCLPVDPFYLSWKAREFDFYTEFIELAGKINENMPYFCLEKITRALNSQERAIKGSHVHLVGVAYKADVGDLRESPALKLIELLREEGADVSYHDPHVPELHEHALASRELDGAVAEADCVAIVTAHSGIDYGRIADDARLVVDFRNATGRRGAPDGRVWKL